MATAAAWQPRLLSPAVHSLQRRAHVLGAQDKSQPISRATPAPFAGFPAGAVHRWTVEDQHSVNAGSKPAKPALTNWMMSR